MRRVYVFKDGTQQGSADYLRKEEMWEEALAEMMRAEPKDAEESDSTT